MRIQRRNMEEHKSSNCTMRDFACPHCKVVSGTYEHVFKKHWPECKDFPLPCPNKCQEEKIKRQHLQRHIKDCPLEEVRCNFLCGRHMPRKQLQEHQSQHCPKRAITCEYCKEFTATYEEVTKKHHLTCKKYPLPCPNYCMEKKIERQLLQEHRSKPNSTFIGV